MKQNKNNIEVSSDLFLTLSRIDGIHRHCIYRLGQGPSINSSALIIPPIKE
jgi:hypothetical protein